jgi:hypothetical protein
MQSLIVHNLPKIRRELSYKDLSLKLLNLKNEAIFVILGPINKRHPWPNSGRGSR